MKLKTRSVLSLIAIAVVMALVYYGLRPEATPSLVAAWPGSVATLRQSWANGDVVALVRHTERCDRSDNQCLVGEDGITVPGEDAARSLGQQFRRLPLDKASIYHSPVKRTRQTAAAAFGGRSEERRWLREGCKENLYRDILGNKVPGQNLVLVTHSTCIDRLADEQGGELIVMDIHEASSYGVAIFLLFEQGAPDFSVLGYLYLDQWDEAFR